MRSCRGSLFGSGCWVVVASLLIGFPLTMTAQEELLADVGASCKAVLPYAERGDPAAQFILGTLLSKTRDRNRNVPEAVKWYEKSANQGLAKAQFALAEIYYQGTDVPENYQEAIKWYQAAARQEFPKAEVALGTLFKEGKAIAKNLAHAAHWYGRAARRGEVVAQVNMGDFYAAGLAGLPQDKVEAYKWYVLAAGQGDERAIEQRDALRGQMTTPQILDSQAKAASLSDLPVRLNPRLQQQDADIQKRVNEFETMLAAGPPAL